MAPSHLSHVNIISIFPSNAAAAAKSLQSCLTLCNPRDGSPPGSPVPGILQSRTLECCHFLLQCMKVKSEREVAQSYPTPSDPMDCSLPGSSVHGILQARTLEWVAIAFSIPSNAATAKSLQSCPTLCDPIDGSPPGSTIPGILQARTLEWVAISFSIRLMSLSQITGSTAGLDHTLSETCVPLRTNYSIA